MRTLGRLIAYLRHQKRLVAGFLTLLMVGSFMRTVPPTLTKFAIDEGVINANLGVLFGTVGGFAAAVILSNVIMAGRLYASRWSSQLAIHDIRNDLFMHLSSKSMSFFDEHQTGDLMSRVTNDINLIQFFFNMAGNVILSAVALSVFNLAFMFALDWTLTLALLGLFPLIFLTQISARSVMRLFRAANQQMGVVNVAIRDAVSGVKVIQAFGREAHQEAHFERENRKLRDLRISAMTRVAAYFSGVELVAGMATVLILGLGAWKVINTDFTLGSLVAFQSYLLLMLMPTRFLGFAVQISQQAVTAGERVFQIIDTPLEVAEAHDAVDLPPARGAVVFEHVTFRYGDAAPILRDLDFEIPAGSTLAIVGRSGAGKSTIVNLLPRFYDPSEGRILIDGVDVRALRLRSLRSQIGTVMQETFLFNMSVRDNIRFGRPDASDAEVEAATRAAAAHEFIVEMSQGYDTVIGDRGVKLSGGQRQRMAIARALLVEPRILILDEATSSVDTMTDRQIRRALVGLMADRTTLVIAHRLSTIERADQILVLADGAIAARGTHRELLATSATYRAIYDLQFRLQAEGLEAGAEPTGALR